jgi:hypothetical protein
VVEIEPATVGPAVVEDRTPQPQSRLSEALSEPLLLRCHEAPRMSREGPSGWPYPRRVGPIRAGRRLAISDAYHPNAIPASGGLRLDRVASKTGRLARFMTTAIRGRTTRIEYREQPRRRPVLSIEGGLEPGLRHVRARGGLHVEAAEGVRPEPMGR